MTNLFQYPMLLAACIALSGCADTKWINGLTGEPDDSIGQNRAGIPRVDSQGAHWPNLATVPPRPGDVPPLAARQQQVGQLSQDRSDGLMLLQGRNVPAGSAPPSDVPLLIGLDRAVKPSAP